MDATSASLRLSIAGIGIELLAPGLQWIGCLRDHYAPFLSHDQPAWRVQVAASHQGDTRTPSWIQHQGSVTRFRIGIYGGLVDLTARKARVAVAEPQQAPFATDRVLAFVCMQELARQGRGLLLHGAGVEYRGRGLAFCGPSGAGKTTVAQLAVEPSAVLTDEALIVTVDEPPARLLSTPFWGASTPARLIHRCKRQIPLRALLILEQWPRFELLPLQPGEAVMSLLATEKVATERVSSAAAWLTVADGLVAQVPVFTLRFKPDRELWAFLDGELFGH